MSVSAATKRSRRRTGLNNRHVQRSLEPRKGSHLCFVVPDIHFPHHDPAALDCVLLAHAALKPKRTIILGDMLDAQAFSAHPVKSLAEERAGTFFESEILPAREFLSRLEENTDQIDMLEGNHEQRVERTILNMGGVMEDLADLVSPQRLLSEGRTKPFAYVPYAPKSGVLPHVKIAKDLIAVHGWTWCRHAAAKHLDQSRNRSVVFGHIHRKQSYMTRDPIDNRTLQAWSPGCLSKLQPLYQTSSPTEWVHGFSLVWVTDDLERWTSYSPTIDRGVCVLPSGQKCDATRETVE